METINISIPADWLPEQRPSPTELREALQWGLRHLSRQRIEPRQHRERVRAILVEAGLAQSQPEVVASTPFSPEERLALAQRAAAGGSLSEIIIADRADRV